MGCRIIDDPKQRLMAVLTNGLIPCNGRFGALILLLTVCLVPSELGSLGAALGLTGLLVLAVGMTMVVCRVLSLTLLRGMPTAFVLEMPPFRRPRVGQVLLRSVLDRTVKVLGRAVLVAAPAGLVLWLLQMANLEGQSLLTWMTKLLDPLGRSLGMSGVLLGAFILGWPANEIVLPVAVLAATGAMELEQGAVGMLSLGLSWEGALSHHKKRNRQHPVDAAGHGPAHGGGRWAVCYDSWGMSAAGVAGTLRRARAPSTSTMPRTAETVGASR